MDGKSWALGFLMGLVIVVMVPLILVFAFPMPEINNTQWTNEQYHIINDKYEWGGSCPPDGVCRASDGSELGTAFWYVLGICVLVTIGMLIWIYIAPEPVTDNNELFERYDGRR
jgi:hypothetical protein